MLGAAPGFIRAVCWIHCRSLGWPMTGQQSTSLETQNKDRKSERSQSNIYFSVQLQQTLTDWRPLWRFSPLSIKAPSDKHIPVKLWRVDWIYSRGIWKWRHGWTSAKCLCHITHHRPFPQKHYWIYLFRFPIKLISISERGEHRTPLNKYWDVLIVGDSEGVGGQPEGGRAEPPLMWSKKCREWIVIWRVVKVHVDLTRRPTLKKRTRRVRTRRVPITLTFFFPNEGDEMLSQYVHHLQRCQVPHSTPASAKSHFETVWSRHT